MSNKIIIISGPTASGKTSLAIEIAKQLHTEIISADSRQCYKELNIGVARPSEEELKTIPHHFIATHSIHEKLTAAFFETYALQKTEEIFKTHDHVVMVGGTGLYIKAFTDGMDEIPEVPETLHDKIIQDYKMNGISWLQDEVKKSDPVFFEKGENQNPQRLMRALEVIKSTGRSILEFRKGNKIKRDFDIEKIAIELPKEKLHSNISIRVEQMMEKGLMEEVRTLIPFQHLNALQTVGYKELFDHFNGQISLVEAVEQIKSNTRKYAKRQLTWFKKEGFEWMKTDEIIKRFTK